MSATEAWAGVRERLLFQNCTREPKTVVSLGFLGALAFRSPGLCCLNFGPSSNEAWKRLAAWRMLAGVSSAERRTR